MGRESFHQPYPLAGYFGLVATIPRRILLLFLSFLLVYLFLVQPWLMRWGATDIVPEWQETQVGDPVFMMANPPPMDVDWLAYKRSARGQVSLWGGAVAA